MITKEIQKEYHTTCFKLFMQYFEKLLHENRVMLDVAEDNKIYKLQGGNEILKMLLKLKEEKREIKYTTKDGGFGEM